MAEKHRFIIFVDTEVDSNADEVEHVVTQVFKKELLKLKVVAVREDKS